MVMLSSKTASTPPRVTRIQRHQGASYTSCAAGLELGPDGIRVNAVAPGNVFEGSKIWNPEYIKAAAKKKGIQPEEVIPITLRSLP